MISKEKYDSLIEALYFSSNPKIKDSIIDGLQANHSDCIDEENVKWQCFFTDKPFRKKRFFVTFITFLKKTLALYKDKWLISYVNKWRS